MGNHELDTMNGPIETVSAVLNGGEKKVDKEKIEHDYEEVLAIIGFGRVQVKIVLAAALVLLMVMNELMGISVITIASECDFQLDEADKGVMHGVVLWGKIISSYYLGYLSDVYGRRKILIITNLGGGFFSLATMFVSNYTVFVVFRFFIGFFTGGAVGISLAYLAEFCAAQHRPVLMNFANIANAVSFVYVPVAAWLILLMKWEFVVFENFIFRPWRILIFFNLLPGLVSSLLMLKYPESPKFLLALGRREEAYDALDWVCKENRNGCTLSQLKVHKLKDLDDYNYSIERHNDTGILQAFKKMRIETLALFKPPHVLNFLASSIAMSGSFVISFGLGVWYPNIQNILGSYNSSSLPPTVCEVLTDQNRINETHLNCNDNVTNKSLFDYMIYGAISLLGYIILGLLINPRRRKALLIGMLTAAAFFGGILIWLTNPTAIVVTFSLYIVLSDLAVSTILGFLVDLLPTKLCGQGSCLIMTSARISGAASTYIIGLYLMSGCVRVFNSFAVMALICAILSYFLNPRYGAKVDDIP